MTDKNLLFKKHVLEEKKLSEQETEVKLLNLKIKFQKGTECSVAVTNQNFYIEMKFN